MVVRSEETNKTTKDYSWVAVWSEETNRITKDYSRVCYYNCARERGSLLIRGPSKFKWRFVDAHAFIYSGVIRIVHADDIGDLDFVAISYVWTNDTRKWINDVCSASGSTYEEKIAQVSGMLPTSATSTSGPDGDALAHAQLFLTIVHFSVLARGKKLFWIDMLCIDQNDQQEKNYFVPLMGDLYHRAAETHAYPFGSKIPSSVSSDEVYFPLWETRAWTAQEQILSRRLLFCYAFQGDVREDLRNISGGVGGSGPERVVDLHSPMLDRYQYAGGMYLLHTKGSIVTCNIQQEMRGNLPTGVWISDATVTSFGNGGPDTTRQALTRTAAYQSLSTFKKSHVSDVSDTARICMVTLTSGRKSSVPEDMIYSILGPLGLPDFPVEYGIGFEEARLQVFEALSPKILAQIIGSEWVNGSTAGNKDSALPRVDSAAPVACITDFSSTIRNCKYTRNIGTRMNCRRETFRVWTPDGQDILDQGFVRSTLGSGLLLMHIAFVFDTPEVASMPTEAIPRDQIKVTIADESTFGTSSDGDASKIDRVVEFVEIGRCEVGFLLPSLPRLTEVPALLALYCEKAGRRTLVNKGTVLITDASALSTGYDDIVIA